MAIRRGRMRARVAPVAAPRTLFARMRAELHRRRRQPLDAGAGRTFALYLLRAEPLAAVEPLAGIIYSPAPTAAASTGRSLPRRSKLAR